MQRLLFFPYNCFTFSILFFFSLTYVILLSNLGPAQENFNIQGSHPSKNCSQANYLFQAILLSLKVLSLFDYVKLLNVISIHQIKIKGLPIPVLKTFDLESLAFNVRNHRPSRDKPGLLKLPNISTVNYSIRYQCVVSWNLLQSFFQF